MLAAIITLYFTYPLVDYPTLVTALQASPFAPEK
jgi:hypothetical protein